MKSSISFDSRHSGWFFTEQELQDMGPKVKLAHEMLHSRTGTGKEFTGWMNWPERFDREEYNRLKQVSEEIRDRADALVVIGVGGSYMGARAALEMLQPVYRNQGLLDKGKGPEIYFAGHHISSLYMANLLKKISEKKEIYVNVISKSGTTLEPAIAFRVLRRFLEDRYGREGAKKRIIATTDKEKGVLKKMADQENYRTFVVPDDIGGRYSVLTPVGLLPIAVGGMNVDEIMEGAAQAQEQFAEPSLEKNPAYQYAALRNLFYAKGRTVELLVNYEPAMHFFGEWWKQLFGESEGKNFKGIFPASALFSTDLHSLGQYIQEGRRDLFTTTLWIDTPPVEMEIPFMNDNEDGLNLWAGKKMHEIKRRACAGIMRAHSDGGVPNLKIIVPEMTSFYFGQLIYFFEKACGISGYLLGVNPFDQPGVEMYKKHVSRLLAKSEFVGE